MLIEEIFNLNSKEKQEMEKSLWEVYEKHTGNLQA